MLARAVATSVVADCDERVENVSETENEFSEEEIIKGLVYAEK